MQNLKNNLEFVNKTSSMTSFKAKSTQFVKEILRELKLEEKYFAIIINGQKVTDSRIKVNADDEILILPKISGG